MQVSKLLGDDVNQMFSRPMRFRECKKPIRCATAITYKKECEYRNTPKDVIVCCHMDSKDVFKVDDYRTAKYVIALSWTLDGLNAWKARWKAENVLDGRMEEKADAPKNALLLAALQEMNVRMCETKNLSHFDDA